MMLAFCCSLANIIDDVNAESMTQQIRDLATARGTSSHLAVPIAVDATAPAAPPSPASQPTQLTARRQEVADHNTSAWTHHDLARVAPMTDRDCDSSDAGDEWINLPHLDVAPITPVVAVAPARKGLTFQRNVGYQDDQYFRLTIGQFACYEPILVRTLAAHGHHLQAAKSAIWVPRWDDHNEQDAPQQLQHIWQEYPRLRHSMPALGSSAGGENAIEVQGAQCGLSATMKRATNVIKVVEAVCDMIAAQAHEQCLHVAWTILTKSCAHAFDYDARLIGAARLEPVVGHAREILGRALHAIAGPIDSLAARQLKLPGCFGGMGCRDAAEGPYAAAALWATLVSNGPQLKAVLRTMDAAARPMPELEQAAESLLAAGIDVSSGFATYTPAAALRYNSTPWAMDRKAAMLAGTASNNPSPSTRDDAEVSAKTAGPAGKQRAGQLFLALDALAAAELWHELPPPRRAILLAAGGQGSGSMWNMIGLGAKRTMQNGHFREAIRQRLGQSIADPQATCQLLRDATHDLERTTCSELMDHPSGMLVHPHVCTHGAARMRAHRAISHIVGRHCRALGAAVDYERHIPHLYQWDAQGHRYTEAILDIAITWPGEAIVHSYDVCIGCPLADRYTPAATRHTGQAATNAEKRKMDRYGESVGPISLETYGRLGYRSQIVLADIARTAAQLGTLTKPPGMLVRALRQDIDLALAFSNADNALLAQGALSMRAGPTVVPISRIVRALGAGSGEHQQAAPAEDG
jgi:hypothetical protein